MQCRYSSVMCQDWLAEISAMPARNHLTLVHLCSMNAFKSPGARPSALSLPFVSEARGRRRIYHAIDQPNSELTANPFRPLRFQCPRYGPRRTFVSAVHECQGPPANAQCIEFAIWSVLTCLSSLRTLIQ